MVLRYRLAERGFAISAMIGVGRVKVHKAPRQKFIRQLFDGFNVNIVIFSYVRQPHQAKAQHFHTSPSPDDYIVWRIARRINDFFASFVPVLSFVRFRRAARHSFCR
jgi:hypothetical protein